MGAGSTWSSSANSPGQATSARLCTYVARPRSWRRRRAPSWPSAMNPVACGPNDSGAHEVSPGAALAGNASAGTLVAVFDTELTTAIGTCASCGVRSLVGEFAVYLRGPGTVVRCRHCATVVMVIVDSRGVSCVDLHGLEALEPAA